MIDLIREGGPLFTIPQTLLALVVAWLAAASAVRLRRDAAADAGLQRRIGAILQLGLLCLFLGVLAQTIGLVQALGAIRAAGDISPSIVIQGFMVSLIAPLYGLSICLISVVLWLYLKRRVAAST